MVDANDYESRLAEIRLLAKERAEKEAARLAIPEPKIMPSFGSFFLKKKADFIAQGYHPDLAAFLAQHIASEEGKLEWPFIYSGSHLVEVGKDITENPIQVEEDEREGESYSYKSKRLVYTEPLSGVERYFYYVMFVQDTAY